MDWDLEELAREALERADVHLPIDADVLARRLGFTVRHGETHGLLIGSRIFIDDDQRPEMRQFGICHELGHALARAAGLADTEWRANYLASALLLPRDGFERDLRRCGWDLLALRCAHRNASFEAVARRLAALREARVVIFDRPLPPRPERPRWQAVPFGGRPSDEERIAAREAVLSGAPVEMRAGLTAWPVLQHDWHRAITIAAR